MLSPRLNRPRTKKDMYREEIIEMVKKGMVAKEIADSLGCTARNVHYVMRSIREQTGEVTLYDAIYQLRNRVKALEGLVAKLALQVNRRIPCADPVPASVQDTEPDTLRSPKPPNRRDYTMESDGRSYER